MVLIVETGDELVGVVAHAVEEVVELLIRDARQDARVGDLVSVEVQDREHDSIGAGVDQLVGLPASGQRSGLRFAVADDGRNEKAGVVHHRAIGVRQRVSELSTLMDGSGGLRRVVRGDSARVGELAEELLQASLVLGDLREVLGVGPIEVGLGGSRRAAVAGSHDDDRVLLVVGDKTIDVADEEVQAGGGSPVSNKAVLDVLASEGLLHQRVAAKVDLADGKVIGGAPIFVYAFKGFLGNRSVKLLPRGANNRIRHVYSCTPARVRAIDYYR